MISTKEKEEAKKQINLEVYKIIGFINRKIIFIEVAL